MAAESYITEVVATAGGLLLALITGANAISLRRAATAGATDASLAPQTAAILSEVRQALEAEREENARLRDENAKLREALDVQPSSTSPVSGSNSNSPPCPPSFEMGVAAHEVDEGRAVNASAGSGSATGADGVAGP